MSDKPKGPAWDYCEERGLNEKRGETPLESVIRKRAKDAAVSALGTLAPDEYPDWDERSRSATADLAPLTKIVTADSERGEKVISGAKEGHEATHGTTEEKQQRWSEYQKALEKVHEENPQWGIGSCQDEVAARMKVCPRTIRRRTKKTW